MVQESKIIKLFLGNEFTTLEGVDIKWSLSTAGANKDATIVKFIPFKDSSYEIPESIKSLEQQDKRGNIILLEGVKTGRAKVCYIHKGLNFLSIISSFRFLLHYLNLNIKMCHHVRFHYQ